MKTIPIQAEIRERIGKGGARSARREGRIPAVLYGQGKSFHLSLDRREFVKVLNEAHGENVIFDVTIPGESPLKSIAREVQHDPLSRSAIHVDFQHIDLTKKIHVSIAVHLLGEPEGVRNYGGILEHVSRELAVSCLPADIPASIDIDVSEMMIGDSVHVSDITPENYEFLVEGSQVIAHVAAPTVEKVTEEEEAAEGEAAEGEAAEGEDGKDESKGEEAKGDGEES